MRLRQLPMDQHLDGDAEREETRQRVRREAADCRARPPWEICAQTVFGVGPATARLMLIGEAPG